MSIPMAKDELRQKIFNISLTPINDIYYVPPGMDGSVGLRNDKIDQIIELFNAYTTNKIIEAKLEVWNYIVKTPMDFFEVTDLDTDPTGETKYREYHYCPPVLYVEEKIAELYKALNHRKEG